MKQRFKELKQNLMKMTCVVFVTTILLILPLQSAVTPNSVQCITKWLHSNKNCPFCRAEINNDNMCVVTDEECGGKRR